MTSKLQHPDAIPSKDKLLSEYERKPMRRSLQYDGFIGAYCGQENVDRDGDEVFHSAGYDLRRLGLDDGGGLAVRLLISDGAKYDDVIRILHKLTDVVVISLSRRRFRRSDDDPDDVLADWDRDTEASFQELSDWLDERERLHAADPCVGPELPAQAHPLTCGCNLRERERLHAVDA